MHIKLINKKLLFDNYKVKCALGKRGISNKKKEGDHCTPKGKHKFKGVFFRKDKVPSFQTSLKKIAIKKNMGWCDDPNSKFYNKLIRFPFKYSAEKLYLKDNIYDLVLILDYNTKPVIKNKGSAIFLHISNKKYTPTNGCIAVSLKDMKLLLKKINKKTKISIF